MNPLDPSPAGDPARPTGDPAPDGPPSDTTAGDPRPDPTAPLDAPPTWQPADARQSWPPTAQPGEASSWPPPGAPESPAPAGAPGRWPPRPGPRQRRGVVRGITGFLVVAIVAAASFLAGIGYAGSGLVPAAGSLDTAPPANARSEIGLLYQAWNLVDQHYVDRAALNPKALTYGAISGLVNALGDTGHSDFLTPQEAAALSSDLSGKYQGIGVEISIKTQGPAVISVFDGSPAQKAGLRVGDLILAVNGKDVTSASFDALASQLRGPAGSKVTIRVLDPGATSSRVVTVTREAITVPNVTWAMLPGTKIADVRLEQFAQNAAAQLTAALKAAQGAGATGLILDLRGDPGGYVSEAVGAASQFLPAGDTVFIQRNAAGQETVAKAQAGGVATKMPMVALVDNGTASAAEILAGALQDYGRAPIVGVTTFGTGTVLQTYSLSDGSEVRIGVAEWLTPKGHQIWHKGITPNDVVALPITASPVTPSGISHMTAAQLQKSGDTQLLRGLALLEKKP